MVTCLTAVWEDTGSNLTAGSCVYHDSHCDIVLGTGCTPRSTQPSTFRGTVKWVSALGLSNNKMVMVDMDDSCHFFPADSQSKSVDLVWGLAATSAWSDSGFCIHQMNRVNSCSGYAKISWHLCHIMTRGCARLSWPSRQLLSARKSAVSYDSTINIILVIIIIIIIIIKTKTGFSFSSL